MRNVSILFLVLAILLGSLLPTAGSHAQVQTLSSIHPISFYLPTTLPPGLPACLRLSEDELLDLPTLAQRLPGVSDGATQLESLGWQEAAHRVFQCESPPSTDVSWLDMSVHRFGDAASAAEAIPFFADSRAFGSALQPAPAVDIGDTTAALAGPTSAGTEYTLYLSIGPLLFRVSGISPMGDPRPTVESMMSALFVIALISEQQEQQTSQTVLVAPGASSIGAPGVSYSITDLGVGAGNVSSASNINDRGQVLWAWGTQERAGELQPHSVNNLHIMLWQDGTVTDLTSLGIDGANAINDVGTVLARENDHTVVYQSDSGMISPLSALDGGYAFDINNAGTVVGVLHGNAVVATGGSTETMPMPEGFQPAVINDAGQMAGFGVGVRGGRADQPAFRFADGIITLLPDSQGVDANDLNDAGQVVGNEGPPSLDAGIGGHAFLYDTVTGVFTDIGALPGYENSIASAINTQGQVVGFAWTPRPRAYLYDHRTGLFTELNDLIPPDSGWDLVFANDINDVGQIVGQGLIDGELHAFVLTPTG